MKLNEMLESLNTYPFHMPGHKRNPDFQIFGSETDITEIDGFDNLHNPVGVLKALQEDFSSLYQSKKSILSVNGSTCCVLSAIFALCDYGDTIIISRSCHKSVYNACLIRGLKVIYAQPEYNSEYGVYTMVNENHINDLIKSNPQAKAVVLTSPTYEGIISKIKCSIPVIIDAAHGSHFGFGDIFPSRQQGDIVINSLHKTLPCLTQTAVIHIYNDEIGEKVKKYMDIFETSSPSYILLSACEKCLEFLKNSKKAFKEYEKKLEDFYKKAREIPGVHFMENDDMSRMIIRADNYTGEALAEHLRKNKIEPEGFGLNYVILISTVCDTESGFDILLNALKKLKFTEKSDRAVEFSPLPIPEKVLDAHQIADVKETPLAESEGLICGEYIYAYPPAVPIIIPGEIISGEIIQAVMKMKENGVNIISDGNLKDNIILTKSG